MDRAAKPLAEREEFVPLHRMKLLSRTLRLWEVARQVASWSLETDQGCLGLRERRRWASMRAVGTRAYHQNSDDYVIATRR